MRFTIFAVAAVAFGQAVFASPLTPETTDIAAKFPVFDLDKVQAHPNITLTQGGIHIDAAQAEFPATLLLCTTTSCISCFGFDLSTLPTNECIASGINFQSAAISQPSNEGLPFGVFVGPGGCASFAQLPAVNTCYNVNPAPFSDYAIA
ncbi:hypothetical protein BN946_scf184938.g47 [Trametes cinnabarina]|uniref:Uncharacterized protein n=1 Tax=Pycnoporus cinnabarinus TaxID=5643 RepID=A0A060S1M4_PYCCI|nr:hypothetical protein BN946_scf184938.g47 [Trametes cinnabarina]